MISAHVLNALNGIRHGFFSRRGGVSEGVYESLNCGYSSGDSPDRVETNRARAMERIERPPEALVTARQVHSADVIDVSEAWPHDLAPKADGLVTRVRGLALGILTADCAPVLFADTRAKVIGAAHAGWRGGKAGVLEATIATMTDVGAKRANIVAAIGPCIRQASYEVGPEFLKTFVEENPLNERYFSGSAKEGRYHFDLPAYLFRRLDALGLKEVQLLPIDTCREEDRFFSYRRSVLRGEPDCGRGLSAIALAD